MARWGTYFRSDAWKRRFYYLYNLYPPFLGAGIRIRRIYPGFSRIDIEMGLHFWNRNLLGTQFGGSLYAMADPFFMTLLLERMGRGYVIWDKAATIRFRSPGRGRVYASFEIPDAEIKRLRAEVAEKGKTEVTYSTVIRDDAGATIAEVEKLIYLRAKN